LFLPVAPISADVIRQSSFSIPSNGTAKVRLLGANTAQESFSAVVLSSERKQIKLRCATGVDAAAAVRIDVEGALLLGEVLHTQPDAAGCVLTIEIDQVIPSLSDLTNLLQGILGDLRVPEPVAR
jgi:hypothetical protein